jgi:2-polyprenyl-6-methoxyphenol hydroxylase-like FAD-dependent oxidoreductase
VVVGAGVGGLAAAGVLARSGWQVTLLERADRIRAGRAALLIWPNGASPVGLGGVRRPDGQWLVQPSPDPATAPVVVHREDLHDTLVAGLSDRLEIRTGVQVRGVRINGTDRAAVDDGRTLWEADLVVAADGIDSLIRRRLEPDSVALSAGCTAWRAVIPWYRAPRMPEDLLLGGETLGAGYRFVAASLGERGSSGGSTRGGIYWVATAAGAARPEPPATQLALLRRWFADWHSPIGELLAATEPDDLVQHPVRELRPLPRAFGFPAGPGGVVLLGDSAHAMPHHLGQGACLAFEDAATLRSATQDAVPGEQLRTAIGAYGRLRRPRVVRVARQNRRMGVVLQARGRLALRARDATLGALSPRLLDRAAIAAARWQPPG